MYNHKLKRLIVDSGITQRDLAQTIGVSPATLTHIIKGYNKKAKYLQLIADHFNKPINLIFKGRAV